MAKLNLKKVSKHSSQFFIWVLIAKDSVSTVLNYVLVQIKNAKLFCFLNIKQFFVNFTVAIFSFSLTMKCTVAKK